MRGSLLVSFLDYDWFGGDYMDIFVNGILQKKIYNSTNKLYSVPVNTGDYITLVFNTLHSASGILSLVRRDYTTDDVSGNNGIVDTSIISNQYFSTYSFTISTTSLSYGYEYRADIDSIPVSPTPTVTPTNTATPTVTPTNTQTPTPTQTPTNTQTPTVTPTITPTNTLTPTNTTTPTMTPTPTSSSQPTTFNVHISSTGAPSTDERQYSPQLYYKTNNTGSTVNIFTPLSIPFTGNTSQTKTVTSYVTVPSNITNLNIAVGDTDINCGCGPCYHTGFTYTIYVNGNFINTYNDTDLGKQIICGSASYGPTLIPKFNYNLNDIVDIYISDTIIYPSTYYTFTGCGTGTTATNACSDRTNNRTLYSNVSTIGINNFSMFYPNNSGGSYLYSPSNTVKLYIATNSGNVYQMGRVFSAGVISSGTC